MLKQLVGHGLAIGNSAPAAGEGPCRAAQRCSEVLCIVNIDAMTVGINAISEQRILPACLTLFACTMFGINIRSAVPSTLLSTSPLLALMVVICQAQMPRS
jgi:hypothetical protein